MTGEELRAARTGLNLYQASMAAQLQALGLELPGGQKIDQPALSQMERGRIPIPDEVAAAIQAGQVRAGSDAPPPVGSGGRASAGQQGEGRRGTRRRVTKRQAARREAAAGEQQTGDGAGGDPVDGGSSPAAAPPPPPASEPDPQVILPPRDIEPGDRPPAPTPGGGGVPPMTWDVAAKSQLESDLRDLFAGQNFLVPVRVAIGVQEDGVTPVYEIQHHNAFIPGLAQAVGMVNEYDGQVIAAHAASMAHAWAELADENVQVRRLLMGMTYGGAWRGVIAATLPVLLAIAANHGVGLPGFLGGQPAPTAALG